MTNNLNIISNILFIVCFIQNLKTKLKQKTIEKCQVHGSNKLSLHIWPNITKRWCEWIYKAMPVHLEILISLCLKINNEFFLKKNITHNVWFTCPDFNHQRNGWKVRPSFLNLEKYFSTIYHIINTIGISINQFMA